MSWFLGSESVNNIEKARTILRSRITAEFDQKITWQKEYSPWHEVFLSGRASLSFVQNLHPSCIGSLPAELSKVDEVGCLKNLECILGNPDGTSRDLSERLGTTLERLDLASPEKVDEQQRTIRKALDILADLSPEIHSAFSALVVQVVPLYSTDGRDRRLGSSHEMAKGAIFMGIPLEPGIDRLLEFAVDIAHEVAHQVIITYLAFDDLILSSADRLVFSGVRGTPRPPIRALHAATALCYIVEVERKLLESYRGKMSFYCDFKDLHEKNVVSLKKTLDSLGSECEFSELGRAIYEECASFSSSIRNLGS